MKDYVSVIVGILFIVALFFISYYMKKKYGKRGVFRRQSRHIKSLDRMIMSNDQWLEIIEVADETFLISVSKSSINLISKLDSEKLKEYESYAETVNFKSIFNKYSNIIKGNIDKEKKDDEN